MFSDRSKGCANKATALAAVNRCLKDRTIIAIDRPRQEKSPIEHRRAASRLSLARLLPRLSQFNEQMLAFVLFPENSNNEVGNEIRKRCNNSRAI